MQCAISAFRLRSFTSPARRSAPADEEDDDSGTLPIDGGTTPDPIDAGRDAGECFPVRAFVPFDAGAGSGVTCNPDGVLLGATAPAGLDYVASSNYGMLDGVNVTACVAVEMAEPALIVRVRASSVKTPCVRACGGGYCSVYGRAQVFARSPGQPLRRLAQLLLGATPAYYDIPVPPDVEARQIVVCRGGQNIDAQDVAVHAISAACAP